MIRDTFIKEAIYNRPINLNLFINIIRNININLII